MGRIQPAPGCDDAENIRWLTAAVEGGTVGWPDPRRGRIPIAVVVAAVDPASARRTVAASGCLSAEVGVAATPGTLFADDVERVVAVRDELGPRGRIRLNANGMWNVEEAVRAIGILAEAAAGVEFVGDPCRTTAEVAAVRGRPR